MPHRRPQPFLNWRFLAYLPGEQVSEVNIRSKDNPGMVFDELVVGDAASGFIHLEVMSDGHLWMDVCGVKVNVHYASRRVSVQNECEDGWTMVTP